MIPRSSGVTGERSCQVSANLTLSSFTLQRSAVLFELFFFPDVTVRDVLTGSKPFSLLPLIYPQFYRPNGSLFTMDQPSAGRPSANYNPSRRQSGRTLIVHRSTSKSSYQHRISVNTGNPPEDFDKLNMETSETDIYYSDTFEYRKGRLLHEGGVSFSWFRSFTNIPKFCN